MKRLLWLTLLLGMVFSHAPNLMAADAAKQCEQLTSQEKFKEAFSLCKQAAEQGDARGQSIFGWMYLNGHGVAQDYGEAVKWFRKAAEQGNDAWTQTVLGSTYLNGQGVAQDYGEAAKWFRKAAEQGHAFAQFNLGLMCDNGWGVAQDYGEAVKWWRKAAEQGNADAQFGLGLAYAGGLGVLRSGTAAADWYYKAGLSFLKDGNKEMALTSVEKIKDLQKKGMSVPNAFLADKLLTAIYGDSPERQE